jgi:nucleoside-diphosphate-sugar epimerase
MKYIITGDRGLIGGYLKERLDSQKHECLLNLDTRNGKDINTINLMDYDKKGKDTEVMFHFAAQCKINQATVHPILPFKNNVEGTFNIFEFCRRNEIPKIMITSSSRVLSPEKNPYTASKIYGEELAKAYKQCYGIDYIIIRPSTVYGPCYDETGRLLHTFVTNAMKGEELQIYGDMFKTLDFTYVDDFIDGIMLSMNKWNDEYDISGGDERKVYEVAKMVIQKTNSKSPIKFYKPEIAQPQQVHVDTKKIRDLGFKPKVNLEEGIDKMIAWYKENPSAWKNYKNDVRLFNGKFI